MSLIKSFLFKKCSDIIYYKWAHTQRPDCGLYLFKPLAFDSCDIISFLIYTLCVGVNDWTTFFLICTKRFYVFTTTRLNAWKCLYGRVFSVRGVKFYTLFMLESAIACMVCFTIIFEHCSVTENNVLCYPT